MKTILLCVATAVASVGLSWWFAQNSPAKAPAQADVAASTPGEAVEASGVTEGAAPEVGLRPEVLGTLQSVLVREGDDVEEGQLLAELDSRVARDKVQCARAERDLAKANLAQVKSGTHPDEVKKLEAEANRLHALYQRARDKYERTQRLVQKGAANQEETTTLRYEMESAEHAWRWGQAQHDQAKNSPRPVDVKVAEQKVATAEAALKMAEAELARTRIHAPCAGRVLQRCAEPGELAGPNNSRPVLLLADVSKRRVRAFVEEYYAGRVAKDMPATVTADGLPGKVYAGTVAQVLPRMGKRNLQTDTPGEYKDLYVREVLIDLAAGQDLPLNLRVHARIQAQPISAAK